MNQRHSARLFRPLLALALALGVISVLPERFIQAAIVGGEIFLQGDFIEVGIHNSGSFGTANGAPVGFHPLISGSDRRLGFVVDPGRDGWASGTPPQSGDYFVPGTPEEGWTVEWTVGGVERTRHNYGLMGLFQIAKTSLIETSSGDVRSAVWEGVASNGTAERINITKTVRFKKGDQFFVTTTVMTNTGTTTLNSVEFMRNVDPDQESPLGRGATTRNWVANAGDRKLVVGKGTFYGITLGLGTIDARARVSTEGFSNRDPDAIYESPVTPSASSPIVADQAIALAYRFGNLAPGQSVTFTYAYILNEADLEPALGDLAAVTILQPSGTVSGSSVVFQATTNNVPNTTKIDFYVNDVFVGSDVEADAGGVFQASFNSFSYPNGTITLKATAEFADGRRIEKISTATVDNSGPPISFVTPAGGQTFTGSGIPIQIAHDAAHPPVRVSFFRESASSGSLALGDDLTAPFVSSFGVSGLPVGETVIIKAVGTDSVGRTTTIQVVGTVGANATTTIVSSKPNPSLYGQSVEFTASVITIGGGGVATGNVQFFAGGNPIGIAGLSPAGIATLFVSSLNAGSHTIQAKYLGSLSHGESTSGTFTQVVDKATPTVFWPQPQPIQYGTALSGAQLNATPSVPGTLTYNPAAGTVLPFGTQTLRATFAPADSSNYNSLPVPSSFNANASASKTTGGIVQRPGFVFPQGNMQPYDATGNLARAAGAQPAVVKDSFYAMAIHLAPNLNDGFYGNGSSWIPGTSDSWLKIDLGQVVPVARVLLGRDRTSGYDDRDIGDFTISVATADDVYQDGNDGNDAAEYQLVFDSRDHGYNGVTPLGKTLDAQFPPVMARYVKVRVKTSPLENNGGNPAAIDEVQVISGDIGTNPHVSLQVNVAATTITAVALPNPSTFGQAVDFVATVRTQSAGTPVTSGDVVFKRGTEVIAGPLPLNAAGQASFSRVGWPVGTTTLAVEYIPAAGYVASAGSVSFTVNRGASFTSLVSSQNPSNFGELVTFTASVSAVAPAFGTPAGSVQFQIGGVNTGAPVPLSGDVATMTTSTLAVGTRTVSAVYSGDVSLQGSSASVSHTVNLLPPTFSGAFPNVPGSCICTPLLMNTGATGTRYWWVKASGVGPLTITAVAQAVQQQPSGGETVVAKVYDQAGALVTTLNAAFPAGTGAGTSVTSDPAVIAAASGVYRVEVTTPDTSTLQAHYRLKFEGALAAGTSSPSTPSFEHQPTIWYFSVAPGEDLNVRVFTADTPLPPSPSSMTFKYRLVRPDGTRTPEATLTGPVTGFDQAISVPGAASGIWGLEVVEPSEHYRLDKTSGVDRGLYVTWKSAGEGSATISAVMPSGAPFLGPVTFEVYDEAGTLVWNPATSTGVVTNGKVSPGLYRVRIVPPAGASVDYDSQDVYVFCDQAATVRFVIRIKTTTTVTSTPSPSTYGDSVTFTATVAQGTGPTVPVGSVTFSEGPSTLGTVPLVGGVATFNTSTLPAGPHAVTATYTPTSALFIGSSGSTAHTVNRALLRVEAQDASRPYGDANPTFTATIAGFVLGETLATSGVTGTPSLTTEATPASDVGPYPILAGPGTLFAANYGFTFTNGTLTVLPRAITVTADPQAKVYGDADPALTYQVSGTLPFGDQFTGGLARTAGESVGPYAITQGDLALSANYALSFTGATLSITARPITVTADPQTKVYGDADPALTYQVSGTLPFGDQFTGALARAAGEDVGSYEIARGDLALSNNYALTYVRASLEITKATLTVTANDAARPYGDSNPAFTASYGGFVFGQDLGTSGVTGSPALTTTASPTSAIGSYPITAGPGTLQSTNYAFAFVDGTLTVNRRSTTTTVSYAASPIDEGASTTVTITVTDATAGVPAADVTPGGTLALSASGPIGPVTACAPAPTTTPGVARCSAPVSAIDNDSATVTAVFAQNATHEASSGAGTLAIRNVAPVITTVTGPTTPLTFGSSSTVSVTFTDAGADDTHACTFTWDDGQTTTVNASGTGDGLCNATHTFAAPGVYAVGVEVKDKDNATDTDVFQYVVVFDPSGGFVTGGGFINSPLGAMPSNPTLTGKANFGFVAKYLPGANVPSGQTEFQFKVGNLNFHSTVYEWLVVAGAKAQYKGSGRINNAGDYAFMLTATDGQINGGGGSDKFRIKIWDRTNGGVIYDNTPGGSDDIDGANPQAISGGSIVIHKNGPPN